MDAINMAVPFLHPYLNLLHQFGNLLTITNLWYTINCGTQIGSRVDVVQMHGIVDIEYQRLWATFGTRPEGLTTGGHLIGWEIEEQLFDLICILILPVQTCPFHTVSKALRFIVQQGFLQVNKDALVTIHIELPITLP